MTKGDAPCFKCEDRAMGCHGQCEKYQKFAAEKEKARDERNERKERAAVQRDLRAASYMRTIRHKGQKYVGKKAPQ